MKNDSANRYARQIILEEIGRDGQKALSGSFSVIVGCGALGSVIADLQAELFDLVKCGDLDAGRRLNDRIAPLVSLYYAPPFVDMHNRMKEALAILGRIDTAVVRPPLQPISQKEREKIRKTLTECEITGK